MKTQSKSSKPANSKKPAKKPKPAKPKTPAKKPGPVLVIKEQDEFPNDLESLRLAWAQAELKKWQKKWDSRPSNLAHPTTAGRAKAKGVEAKKKVPSGDPVQEIESKLSNDMVLLKGASGVCGPFQIAKYIVTMGEWNATVAWAKKNKKEYKELEIVDASEKSGETGKNHPKRFVDLREAAMWCNAKSEQEKLKPCYYLGGEVFRSGLSVSGKKFLEWRPEKNGYRLPTLMEWRFAYGSHDEKHFEHLKGFVAEFSENCFYEVGTYEQNQNGIYDLTKLVRQWVWEFLIEPEPGAEFSRVLGTSNSVKPSFVDITQGELLEGIRGDRDIGFRLARNAK